MARAGCGCPSPPGPTHQRLPGRVFAFVVGLGARGDQATPARPQSSRQATAFWLAFFFITAAHTFSSFTLADPTFFYQNLKTTLIKNNQKDHAIKIEKGALSTTTGSSR